MAELSELLENSPKIEVKTEKQVIDEVSDLKLSQPCQTQKHGAWLVPGMISIPVVKTSDDKEPKKNWDAIGPSWNGFVGRDGERDPNRVFLTDPLVQRWLGRCAGQLGVDIGCGNGYWARRVYRQGAACIAIDPAASLIRIARAQQTPTSEGVEYAEGSASRLEEICDDVADFAMMNYILMDCGHLEPSIGEAFRILKPGGKLIVVMTHPCFPIAYQRSTDCTKESVHQWAQTYQEEHQQTVTLQGLEGEITVFHRPIQTYFHELLERRGFILEDIEEPHLSDYLRRSLTPHQLATLDTVTPVSIAFLLRKPERPVLGDMRCVSREHPCFSNANIVGDTCTWHTSYFQSLTLSETLRVFLRAGSIVMRAEEIYNPAHNFPTAIIWTLMRPSMSQPPFFLPTHHRGDDDSQDTDYSSPEHFPRQGSGVHCSDGTPVELGALCQGIKSPTTPTVPDLPS